jgi:molybdate transport system substrate-binding protein
MTESLNLGRISRFVFAPVRATGMLFVLLSLVTLFACQKPDSATSEITVAAAADLIPALEQMGAEFERTHGTRVTFSFGSTGLLTRQIENGAPMDLFMAASADYINQLESKGLIVPDTRAVYARGRLTLWTPRDNHLKIEKITDLVRPEIKRIAIANPDHAPYGIAAREALEKAGVWESVKSKLVYGENIRQTLQFAQTGNVEVAIVALSLTRGSDGIWVLVPEELHQPLNQVLAVIKGTKNEKAARDFAEFVTGERGREILRQYGFSFPDESPGQ